MRRCGNRRSWTDSSVAAGSQVNLRWVQHSLALLERRDAIHARGWLELQRDPAVLTVVADALQQVMH